MQEKKTLRDIDIAGKKVLMRVDFNVPLKGGVISDNTRIEMALPSIRYILEKGGSLILMSHLGRPKGKINPIYSLRPCAEELSRLLSREVTMAPDSVGGEVKHLASTLKPGEVLMLENCRFHREEDSKENPKERKDYARELASLGDVYANDAFGTAHRRHASTADVAELLPSVSGFLMEKELKFLREAVESPKRPLVSIMGGAKIGDKIPLIRNLLGKVDKIIIGGGMAYTFYKAMGLEVGRSLVDNTLVETCREFLEREREKVILPTDCLGSRHFDFKQMRLLAPLEVYSREAIPPDVEGLDIGEDSVAQFRSVIEAARTLLWNGPVGIFECDETAGGTFAVAKLLAEATDRGAMTIIGGGDSAAAVRKAGLIDKMSHISTGGGACLKFLEGKELPGVAALDNR